MASERPTVYLRTTDANAVCQFAVCIVPSYGLPTSKVWTAIRLVWPLACNRYFRISQWRRFGLDGDFSLSLSLLFSFCRFLVFSFCFICSEAWTLSELPNDDAGDDDMTANYCGCFVEPPQQVDSSFHLFVELSKPQVCTMWDRYAMWFFWFGLSGFCSASLLPWKQKSAFSFSRTF